MDYREIVTYSHSELAQLIEQNAVRPDEQLLHTALEIREEHYGRRVFIRGLVEFTNYCRNNCYYCGIRSGNAGAHRYRLTKRQILSCCAQGYDLGLRTFVLQGGEDLWFNDERMCDIISTIRQTYPDCAITLSIGEQNEKSYRAYYEAGANRFLLRHETADETHYSKLHPANLNFSHRKDCLYQLKEIGFQVGAGFMVGSPYQTYDCLASDLLFLKSLQPHMVGIGPFIPHKDTPFADYPHGSLNLTLTMLALTRILLPKVLLPSTTALGSIDDQGREMGFSAGANVVMPNLSPGEVRKDYMLYDGKVSSGSEAAESLCLIKNRIELAGFELDMSRGDHADMVSLPQTSHN